MLVISHTDAMKETCREVLALLLTRAQEREFRLSVVLMGTADREAVLMQQSELREYALLFQQVENILVIRHEEIARGAGNFSKRRVIKFKMTLIHNDLPSLGMNSNGPEKYGKGASWSIYGQGKNNLSASSNTGFFDGQSFSLALSTVKKVRASLFIWPLAKRK